MKQFLFLKYTIIILLLSVFACEDPIDSNIPYVPVNARFDLSDPRSAPLQSIGECVTDQEINPNVRYGYRGLIIYNSGFNGYYAFDRCCTYNHGTGHIVNPEGLFAVCPIDSSRFSIGDGSGMPVQGPAEVPLKRYNTRLERNYLLISN